MVADGCPSTSDNSAGRVVPGPLEARALVPTTTATVQLPSRLPSIRIWNNQLSTLPTKRPRPPIRARYTSTTAPNPNAPTTTAVPSGLTLSRDNVQVVANVMPGRELLVLCSTGLKQPGQTTARKLWPRSARIPTLTFWTLTTVPSFLACNAIYGFSIAEECVSVLDPRYEHLLDENGATFTPTAVQIEKAIQQCQQDPGTVLDPLRSPRYADANYKTEQRWLFKPV